MQIRRLLNTKKIPKVIGQTTSLHSSNLLSIGSSTVLTILCGCLPLLTFSGANEAFLISLSI